MDPERRARLEAAGFVVMDDPYEWLGLTPEEGQVIDLSLAVLHAVQQRFAASGLNRRQLARRLRVKLSELTEMENGCGSLELLFQSLFLLGGSLADVVVKQRPSKPARHRKKIPA